MIDPALGSQLADLGGFALFLLLVVVIGVGLIRRWWVPGWVYQQERDARAVAETQALRNAESLEKLARIVERERARKQPAPKDGADVA
jgi:uncharacterized membrane protein YciS (DUF1049 family)